MLETLSDATLYLAKQKLPPRDHDESPASLTKGRELLEWLAKFDSVFDSQRACREGVFIGVSADIQNDPMECIYT